MTTLPAANASPLSMRQATPVSARERARQFVIFAAVGLLATAIQYAVLFVSVRRWHLDPVLGSSAGFLLSAAANYLLNYHLTFRSASPHVSAATRFAIIASAGFVLNGAIMFALTQWLHMLYVSAQLLATGAVLIWNFLGSALWTFTKAAGDRS